MRDDGDLRQGHAIDRVQAVRPLATHHHEPGREPGERRHDAPLRGIRLAQDGVERRDERGLQAREECQDMRPRRPAEDAVLVL